MCERTGFLTQIPGLANNIMSLFGQMVSTVDMQVAQKKLEMSNESRNLSGEQTDSDSKLKEALYAKYYSLDIEANRDSYGDDMDIMDPELGGS